MPSDWLKAALKGNEVALTEMTYQFQNHLVLVDDLLEINNSKKQDTYSRYLKCLSFYFYTPEEARETTNLIENNEKNLLKLANDDKMALAQNLLAHYYSNNKPAEAQQYEQLAIKQCNGLATFNYLHRKLSSSTAEDTSDAINVLEKSAAAFSELMQTSYRDEAVALLEKALVNLQAIEEKPSESQKFFQEKPQINVASLWIKFANFHRNFKSPSLMYLGLQNAALLNESNKKEWLSELNVNTSDFKKVNEYLESYLQILKSVQGKFTHESTASQLKNALLFLKVERNNCSLLTEEFSKTADKEKINTLNNINKNIKILFNATDEHIKKLLTEKNLKAEELPSSYIQKYTL